MQKRVFALITSILLVFSSTNAVFAGSNISINSGITADVVVSMQIGDPLMEVNGVETEIDAGRGTKPTITDGRTLVPIRAIIEAFDGTVGWDGATQTVTLSIKNDVVQLAINSSTAYFNSKTHTLDVAPTIINERTMLPIRFIAESFNLGVSWEGSTQTVTIIRNGIDQDEYNYLLKNVPAYNGTPYVKLNNNVPFFKEYEIIGGSFEYYSTLDSLGRCDVCMTSVATDLMPTDDRESISSVTPTGWINTTYDSVPGKYLYNRCHLIGYQLTGENANERNLITGTRYLNIDGMLPFENQIDDYVEKTGNHVVYRVTPFFKDNNLVAHGVLLEAYSVEDNGKGISFCVFCYNVQPNITIDYVTGKSSKTSSSSAGSGGSGGSGSSGSSGSSSGPAYSEEPSTSFQPGENETPLLRYTVYRTPTGKKYHYDADCGGKNSYEVRFNDALNAGLTPCAKCAQ